MLHHRHYLALMLFVPFSTTGADEVNPALYAPLTVDERAQLQKILRVQTVRLDKQISLDPRFTRPGARPASFQGWRQSSTVVVTSSAIATGGVEGVVVQWPEDETSKVVATTVDSHLGLAYAKAADPNKTDKTFIAKPLSSLVLSTGTVLYGLNTAGAMGRYTIVGQGTDHRSYFYRILGQLPPGTPLFDARGSLVTLVAYGPNLGGTESWVLPSKAIHTFVTEVTAP